MMALAAVAATVTAPGLPGQMIPQQGRVRTVMEADSVTAWWGRLGVAALPLPRGDAFRDLGPGLGVHGAVSARFANGLVAGLRIGWATLGDDRSPERARLLDVAAEFAWSGRVGTTRVEAGPVAGVSRLQREDLTSAALGALAGAGVRGWRSLGERWATGLGVELAWSVFGDLETRADVADPDRRSDGFRPSVEWFLTLRLDGAQPSAARISRARASRSGFPISSHRSPVTSKGRMVHPSETSRR